MLIFNLQKIHKILKTALKAKVLVRSVITMYNKVQEIGRHKENELHKKVRLISIFLQLHYPQSISLLPLLNKKDQNDEDLILSLSQEFHLLFPIYFRKYAL